MNARLFEIPVVTPVVTQWTHFDRRVTDVLGWLVAVECGPRVDKTGETNNGGWDKHMRVESKPGEIQRYFNTEIFADVIQGLVAVPFANCGPFGVE